MRSGKIARLLFPATAAEVIELVLFECVCLSFASVSRSHVETGDSALHTYVANCLCTFEQKDDEYWNAPGALMPRHFHRQPSTNH